MVDTSGINSLTAEQWRLANDVTSWVPCRLRAGSKGVLIQSRIYT